MWRRGSSRNCAVLSVASSGTDNRHPNTFFGTFAAYLKKYFEIVWCLFGGIEPRFKQKVVEVFHGAVIWGNLAVLSPCWSSPSDASHVPPTDFSTVVWTGGARHFYNARKNISVGGWMRGSPMSLGSDRRKQPPGLIVWSPSQLCTQSFSLSNLLMWDCPPAVWVGHPLVSPFRFTRRSEQLLHLLLLFAIKIQWMVTNTEAL